MKVDQIFENVTEGGGALAIIQVKVKQPQEFMDYVRWHLPFLPDYGGSSALAI